MKQAAEIIKTHKGEIMRRWRDEAREKVQGADFSNDMVLLNHLPDLLDDLVRVLKSSESFEQMMKNDPKNTLFKMSTEHGRHRSASFGYTIGQVIQEYIIFHGIITDLLISEDAYTVEVSRVIKFAVETSMMFSSAAFNDSLDEIRQRFLRILAHDLRNPVSSALLGVEMIENGDETERFEKIRRLSKSSLKRALNLLEDLLDSMSVQAGEGMTVNFSEEDLMKYIESVHFEASEIYTNEIQLEVEGDRAIKGVFDGAMLRRVLENFLSNAVKYGKKDTPVKILVQNADDVVTIKVHNFGKPIPEEKKEKIFQFLKTSRNRDESNVKSWGIGLALVKAVVEAHSGELWVESNEKDGTTFGVILGKYQNKPGKIKTAVSFSQGFPSLGMEREQSQKASEKEK